MELLKHNEPNAYSDSAEERTEFLRELRSRNALSQSELAKICNVSVRTVQGWEGKKQTPAPVTALLDRIETGKGLFP